MPRNDHEITDRVYSRLRAVLYVSLAIIIVCLALNGVFFGVELLSQRSLVPGEWAVALLSQAMAIAFAIVFLFAYRKLRALEVQLIAIAPFFKNSVYLWPKDVFDRNGARLLNRKKGGLVVALHIRGLESEIVSFYGQDELRQVNTFIYESIKARFSDPDRYHFGFTMMNDFLILSAGEDQSEFYKAIESMTDEIFNKIAATGKVINISLLYGGDTYHRGDKMSETSDHAISASRFNESSRFSSEIAFYSQEQKDALDSEKSMPSEIMEGINKEQFQIYYQPKFDLATKKFLGAEALVRWNHPTRGLLPPSFFIPFSERSGMITVLDHYIYERVMSDMEKWLADGEYVPRVSINISRRTIYDKGVIRFLKETALKHHVPPHKIEMELTESLAAKDSAYLYQLVNKIKSIGMTTSIDDFGTGYSSLNSLKRLPFDVLKIDKSFIDDIEVDKKARDIVRAIIEISHSLNLYTVAEGVETEGQIAILTEMGLDSVQGFYFSKPRPNYEFRKFLKENPFDKEGYL